MLTCGLLPYTSVVVRALVVGGMCLMSKIWIPLTERIHNSQEQKPTHTKPSAEHLICVHWIFGEVTVQEVLMGYFTNPMYVPSCTTSTERLLNILFLEPGDQPINDPIKYFSLHDEDFPSVDTIDWVTFVQAIIPVNGRRYH